MKRITKRWMAAALLLVPTVAFGKDPVRLVDTQAQTYMDYCLYLAEEKGYYAAENIDASIIVGRGGSDSLQTVATGSQDIVYGPGVLSVIAAYAKGAPVVIIGNAAYGGRDLFWYVKADSPIKSFKDLNGKSFAYSTPGSMSHLTGQTLARELGITPKFVSTGNLSSTRTQMMTGQVDTAWASFPAGLGALRSGEVRLIGKANDSPTIASMTTRVTVANSTWLAKNRDVAVRTMRAVWKGQVDAMQDPSSPQGFAKKWGLDPEDTKLAFDFNKLEDVPFAPIKQLDTILAIAKEYDFIKEPLTEEQKKGLTDIVFSPKQ